MNLETQIWLNKAQYRSYQKPLIDAIENKGFKKVLAILPRRAGKDFTAFNLCIRQCLKKVCVVYYIFPTYSMAKKVIWESITNDGNRFLDYIPPQVIESTNSTNMQIRFKNGSLLQLIGSDNPQHIRGTNPYGVVFSEYALQHPSVYTEIVRPILRANDGWALFISTPRGKNHFYDMYQVASTSPEWFCYRLTVEDTGHISKHDIERERNDGLMSEDLVQQEYYVSFTLGIEGSYYSKYIDKMRLAGHIGDFPYESGYPVYTAWDIGVRDQTTILFFQIIGETVRVIDTYESNGKELAHYVKVLDQKGYTYALENAHIVPHDMKNREFITAKTRWDVAKDLGLELIQATKAPSLEDGIECVRRSFGKLRIDDQKCAYFLKCIQDYRQEYDVINQIYKGKPLHNYASHWADSLRYMCLTLDRLKPGSGKGHTERVAEHYGQNQYKDSFFDGNSQGWY